jgi:hypothetical protein
MAMSDVFILYDSTQFSWKSYTKRTKIKVKGKEGIWLTIPIGNERYSIDMVLLPQNTKWLYKHKMSLIANYSRCHYFDKSFIFDYYEENKFKKLCEFNEFGIFYLKNKFNIKTKIVRSSELDLDFTLRSTDAIIDMVKKVGGDTYISGQSGKNYLEKEKFKCNNISLKNHFFKPREYQQSDKTFEPYLSSIDLWFNLGKGSLEHIFDFDVK